MGPGPPGRCLVLQAQPFQDDQGARPTSNTSVWQVDHGLAGWHLATSYGGARSSHPSLGLATCSADAASLTMDGMGQASGPIWSRTPPALPVLRDHGPDRPTGHGKADHFPGQDVIVISDRWPSAMLSSILPGHVDP
jgi:hypothetical protein